MVLPKKYRKELSEEKFYLFLSENGEIWGFDPRNWEKVAEEILKIPLFSKEGKVARLNFFSRAEECLVDSQGRFSLPPEFAEKANLTEEALFIGAGDHFEIWDPQRWELMSRER